VGARSDAAVYDEMVRRVRMLPRSPSALALLDVVERLGQVTGMPEASEAYGSVPEWLLRRLVDRVGLGAEEARSMSLEEAVDAWATWTSRGDQ
jgi:mRNA interferase RelE/StbE